MSVEMALWRMTSDGPVQLVSDSLDAEQRLEDLVVTSPAMLGIDVLVLGRQVRTDYGGFIDVLGMDVDGRVHVLELKRDMTPRDVVAQALDYGSWVSSLGLAELESIYAQKHEGDELAAAFADHFGQTMPDTVNSSHQLTIVASALDPASDRIVEYLAEEHGVPINAVFFRYYRDGDAEYLARTWLLSQDEVTSASQHAKTKSKTRPWNGRDFYTVLGTADGGTGRWEIARRYNVVSAGGGSWYSKPLRNLAPGHRVYAYVGGRGYVGVGTVTGTVQRASDAIVRDEAGREVKLAEAEGLFDAFRSRMLDADDDKTEYVVPVKWVEARDPDDGAWRPGLFASQIPVCKLRDPSTIAFLEAEFELTSESPTDA